MGRDDVVLVIITYYDFNPRDTGSGTGEEETLLVQARPEGGRKTERHTGLDGT